MWMLILEYFFTTMVIKIANKGLTQFQYYTVVFAVSRALGCTASSVWSRALGLPIERPGSVTLDWIEQNAK